MVISVLPISVVKQSLHFECLQLKLSIMSKRQTIQKQKYLQKSNEMTVVLAVAGKNLRTVMVVKNTILCPAFLIVFGGAVGKFGSFNCFGVAVGLRGN